MRISHRDRAAGCPRAPKSMRPDPTGGPRHVQHACRERVPKLRVRCARLPREGRVFAALRVGAWRCRRDRPRYIGRRISILAADPVIVRRATRIVVSNRTTGPTGGSIACGATRLARPKPGQSNACGKRSTESCAAMRVSRYRNVHGIVDKPVRIRCMVSVNWQRCQHRRWGGLWATAVS